VVDAERRPQGWVRADGASGAVGPERVVPGGSLYDTRSGSLRSALDAALSSPSRRGVAVDGEGRAVGSLTADDVLRALDAARGHRAVA
jgi:osmoprotectant transport system ATP-binding protein